jgi:hypothetical protein
MTRPRDNPFASDRIESVPYILQGTTWPQLLARLCELNYRAAITGIQGTGKTTLLESLIRHLHALGFQTQVIQLNSERDRLPESFSPSHDRVLLVDGAEQLPRIAWLRLKFLTRRCPGLIITTHTPGLLPTLIECHTSPKLLCQIVQQLLPNRHMGSCDELFCRHAGNLRSVLRELYDLSGALP